MEKRSTSRKKLTKILPATQEIRGKAGADNSALAQFGLLLQCVSPVGPFIQAIFTHDVEIPSACNTSKSCYMASFYSL